MPNLFFLKPAKTDSAIIHSTMSVNHACEAEKLKMQKNERSITLTFSVKELGMLSKWRLGGTVFYL